LNRDPAPISAFGPLTVNLKGGPVDLGPPRRRAVLAMLLINTGKIVSVSTLLDGIWGARPPERAVATLQSYVSRLRKLVSRWPLADDSRLPLHYRSPGYVLIVVPENIDVARFEQLVDHGVAAVRRADHSRAFTVLGSALAMWTAPPFEDLVDYQFARQETHRLEHVRLTAVEQLAEAAFVLDRDHEILPMLENEVTRNPTRERLVGLLMRAQYRTGRQADALHTFERTRQLLADELGADASPAVQQIHAEILRHDPSLGLVSTRIPAARKPVELERRTVPAPQRTDVATMPAVVPLSGRREELHRLLTALDAAHNGLGRTALLLGEAGLGKTRLVEEFAEFCRASDNDVILVRCPQAQDMPAYWPWTQLLRQLATTCLEAMLRLPAEIRAVLAFLLPELGVADTRSGDRPAPAAFELHDAISRALCQLADQPLVLVLEDFQWVDGSSLAMLRFIARQLVGSRVLLVLTFRTFRITYDAELRATLAALRQLPNVEEIRLTGLDRDRTDELATSAVDGSTPIDDAVRAALYERTRGNPYFVLDFAAHLHAGMTPADVRTLVPAGLREVILERLSALPAEVRAVLDVCSVLDDGGPYAVLEDMLAEDGVSDGVVRSALRGGLLWLNRDKPSRVSFVHPLVRDVIRRELDRQTRAELRRRALRSLVSREGDLDRVSDAVLRHGYAALRTLPVERVVDSLLTEATSAEGRHAYGRALKLLNHASLLAERGGGADHVEFELSVLRRQATLSQIVLGVAAPATLACYDRIEQLDRQRGTQCEITHIGRFFGLLGQGRLRQAQTMLSMVGELGCLRDDPRLAVLTHYGRGVSLHLRGRPQEALAELAQAAERSDEVPAMRLVGCRVRVATRCWQALIHQLDGARDVAWRLLSDAHDAVPADHRPGAIERIILLYTGSLLAIVDADAPRALSAARSAARIAEETGLTAWSQLIAAPLSWARVHAGEDADEAVEVARVAVEQAARAGMGLTLPVQLGLLIDIERQVGRYELAEDHLRQLREHVARMDEVTESVTSSMFPHPQLLIG
jgi:DNA-binding SARP family transcriptional activator